MKRLIVIVMLSLALAIGTTACAHKQLTQRQVAHAAIAASLITGLVLLASTVPCSECNVDLTGPHPR